MNTFTVPTRALKAAAKMAANDPARVPLNQVYIDRHGVYASDSYTAYRYELDLPTLEDRVIAFPAELFKSIKVGKTVNPAIFEEIKDGLWHVDTLSANSDIYAQEFEFERASNHTLNKNIARLFNEHVSGEKGSLGLGVKYLSKIIAAAKIVNESPNLRFDFQERDTGAILVKSTNFDPNTSERAEFLIMPVRL